MEGEKEREERCVNIDHYIKAPSVCQFVLINVGECIALLSRLGLVP